MKKFLQLGLLVLAAATAAHGQVLPQATVGPASFGYSLHYAQSSEFGANIGNWQTIIASGTLDYRNGFQRHPFSLNYAGGYTWTVAGPQYDNGLHQHLVASEGFVYRHWSVVFSDNISYMPQAPITGFPGIPGTGNPGGGNPAPPPDQNVLTLKTRSLDNFVGGQFTDRVNLGTSINASGAWGLLRYPDGNGLNLNSTVASVGLTQRLNARNSLSGSYAFSQFSFPDYNLTFTSNGLFFGFTREWNRRLSTGVNGGPQWVSGSDSLIIPSSSNFAVNGDVRYRLKNTSAGLTYTRGVSGGAGYLLGAKADIVSLNVTRSYGRNLTLGAEGSYRHIAGLNHNGVVSSEDFGVQANRRLGRYMTAFVSYTAIDQGASAKVPSNVLTNVLQAVSFGFTYSPPQKRANQ